MEVCMSAKAKKSIILVHPEAGHYVGQFEYTPLACGAATYRLEQRDAVAFSVPNDDRESLSRLLGEIGIAHTFVPH
jgi:hypothetical protein